MDALKVVTVSLENKLNVQVECLELLIEQRVRWKDVPYVLLGTTVLQELMTINLIHALEVTIAL